MRYEIFDRYGSVIGIIETEEQWLIESMVQHIPKIHDIAELEWDREYGMGKPFPESYG